MKYLKLFEKFDDNEINDILNIVKDEGLVVRKHTNSAGVQLIYIDRYDKYNNELVMDVDKFLEITYDVYKRMSNDWVIDNVHFNHYTQQEGSEIREPHTFLENTSINELMSYASTGSIHNHWGVNRSKWNDEIYDTIKFAIGHYSRDKGTKLYGMWFPCTQESSKSIRFSPSIRMDDLE